MYRWSLLTKSLLFSTHRSQSAYPCSVLRCVLRAFIPVSRLFCVLSPPLAFLLFPFPSRSFTYDAPSFEKEQPGIPHAYPSSGTTRRSYSAFGKCIPTSSLCTYPEPRSSPQSWYWSNRLCRTAEPSSASTARTSGLSLSTMRASLSALHTGHLVSPWRYRSWRWHAQHMSSWPQGETVRRRCSLVV